MTGFIGNIRTLKFDMHNRIVFVAVFFIVALLFMVFGLSIANVGKPDAEDIAEDLNSQFDRFNDPRFIFGNNLLHTLIMFVPIIGPIWGNFVIFNTGSVIAILSIAEGLPPVLTFLFLFFNPIFWLEFGVYSVAMAQSVVWLLQIFRGRGKNEAVRTCILIAICASILLLAAIVEWIMINYSLS